MSEHLHFEEQTDEELDADLVLPELQALKEKLEKLGETMLNGAASEG